MVTALDVLDDKPKPEQDGYLLITRQEQVIPEVYAPGTMSGGFWTVVEEKILFKDIKGWKTQFNCLWIFTPSQGYVRIIPLDRIIEIRAYYNSAEYVTATPEPYDEALTCVYCAGVLGMVHRHG